MRVQQKDLLGVFGGLLNFIALIIYLCWQSDHTSAGDEPIAKLPELVRKRAVVVSLELTWFSTTRVIVILASTDQALKMVSRSKQPPANGRLLFCHIQRSFQFT